jgi:formylglycine-generating enzyme required for sulfatase activity
MGAIWNFIVVVFKMIDRFLVWLAAPFGVHIKDWKKRLGILLGVYAVVYLVASLAPSIIALPVLAFGYLGVLAVGRAWSANEKIRSEIVKKLREGNPDDLPDLRWTALISALQLLGLFPLVFYHVSALSSGLYNLPEGAPSTIWIAFTFDGFCKSLLDWSEVYKVHFSEVAYGSGWAAHLVMLKRLTFDFILIQGIIRIIGIRRDIRDSIGALARTSENVILLGRRALFPLCSALKNQRVVVRRNASKALVTVGDARALQALVKGLKDPDPLVREHAAESLGKIGDRRAAEPLSQLLHQEEDKFVRKTALASLEHLVGDSHAKELLALKSESDSREVPEEDPDRIILLEESKDQGSSLSKPTPGELVEDSVLHAEWSYIPPGTFMMGSPWEEAGRDSGEELHEVTITRGFLMQRTPVTQGEYERLMGLNPSGNENCDLAPVENVDWFDAIRFCNMLSEKYGLVPAYRINGVQVDFRGIHCAGYRLPMEAEWEYACRAGTRTAFWSGECTQPEGEDPNLSKVGWFGGRALGFHPLFYKIAIGEFKALIPLSTAS